MDTHTFESMNENWYTAYKKSDEYFYQNGKFDGIISLNEVFILS